MCHLSVTECLMETLLRELPRSTITTTEHMVSEQEREQSVFLGQRGIHYADVLTASTNSDAL